jgi:hypothetical protein
MKNYILNKIALVTLCLALIVSSTAAQTKNNLAATTPPINMGSQNVPTTVRVGLAGITAGKVGEGVNAQELSNAVGNLLSVYLKGSSVELVPLDAKSAQNSDAEALEKQCAFVLYAQVSHKKGGGGFGKMFAQVAPMLTMVVPVVGAVGAIASTVASTAAVTAAGAMSNVKPKDEITLDLKLQNGAAVAFAKQYKAKAKSGGEDILTPMIEQAAQAIIDASKK